MLNSSDLNVIVVIIEISMDPKLTDFLLLSSFAYHTPEDHVINESNERLLI